MEAPEIVGVNVGERVEISPVDAKELLEQANILGTQLRSLILDCKRLPSRKDLGPHQDSKKCLAHAQADLQTGMMWLRRAIEQPDIF